MGASLSNQRTALITGASTGIGKELAFQFGQAGFDLVLVARNKAKLEQVAGEMERAFGVRAAVLARDLAEPNAARDVYDEVQRAGVTVDVLVNNAGVATYGPLHEQDIDRLLGVMHLNMDALVHLTRLLLPAMVERKYGKVLNVSSIAAFAAGPFMSIYYASKAFVLSFSEALSAELTGTGVTVTVLCPGPTITEFQSRAGMRPSKLAGKGVYMDARTVAELGYRGVMKNKTIVVAGARNKLLVFGSRLVPRFVIRNFTRWVNINR